ncbi:MAG: CBS domain-containing protein [Marinilabiliales bacterium]|nr:MAG: CBS domain-containing protein [Marinilabiliales bacterium]
MIARQLISDIILPLKTSDSGSMALKWMDENKISHLPIVNGENYVGIISEKDILDLNNYEQPIGNHKLSLDKISSQEGQHIYELIELFDKHKLTLLPVVDKRDMYLGSITLSKLLSYLASAFSVNTPGGVIVLEMSQNDYNMTEIANIIESNGAKLLSLFIGTHTNSTLIELILKINKTDLDSILQTFIRYNYIIKATFGDEEDFEDLKDNYDSLMNYLNI